MNFSFHAVYRVLLWFAALTGSTYKEVNIVVYYLVIPLVFALLLDKICKKWIFTALLVISWALLLILVPNFRLFSNRAFDASVVFLQSFSFLGWNYIVASVIICVVMPTIVLAILLHYAFPQLFKRRRSDGTTSPERAG